jgi:hypothetical protein
LFVAPLSFPQTVVTKSPTVHGTEASPEAAFSEELDPATLGTATFKLYKSTTKGTTTEITDVTVTPSVDGMKATLNPYGTSSTLLEKNITYQAVVTGAKDLAGNALDQSPKGKGN